MGQEEEGPLRRRLVRGQVPRHHRLGGTRRPPLGSRGRGISPPSPPDSPPPHSALSVRGGQVAFREGGRRSGEAARGCDS